ncbi:MAG: hypothetical protein QNJ41_08365 [Xenococcaceae cyanobacterium MO_188.B32]|nr:hypothetical protein [Xenococcaceae cyanobacterium MO_188.B32]
MDTFDTNNHDFVSGGEGGDVGNDWLDRGEGQLKQHLSELTAVLPTLKKTQKLLKTQHWPPQPDFELPAIFQVWIDIAQETPQRLHLASSPYEYREWVEQQLANLNTDLAEESFAVLEELVTTSSYEDLSFHPVLCGLLATLTYLGHAFRWGTIPVLPQAREESYIDFPPLMIGLWRRIHEHLQISGDGGCMFSLNLLNCYRTNTPSNQFIVPEEKLILPNRTRWVFNQTPEWRKTEENFNLVFGQMEAQGKYIYLKMSECAELMNKIDTEGVTSGAISHINLILNQIAAQTKVAFDIFFKMREQDVSSTIWVDAVEAPHTWQINGGSGPSGTQTLLINALDAFFQIQGSSLMYATLRKNRARMPQFMRQFSLAMELVGCALRALVSQYSELHEAYNRGINLLRMFRLSHRSKGYKYLAGGKKGSEGTASGTIESVMKQQIDTIPSKFREEMYKRVVETEEAKVAVMLEQRSSQQFSLGNK